MARRVAALALAQLALAMPALATVEEDYDALLRRIVRDGLVDYAALRADRATLDAWLASLEGASPGEERWARVAFWVNAYNGLTLQRVLDTRTPGDRAYRVVDVADFRTARARTVAGRRVSLEDIEGILRGFREPVVHFALCRAAASSPPLQPGLWRSGRLPEDFVQAARAFLDDPRHNEFDAVELVAEVSRLFEWFREDFRGEDGSPGAVSRLQLWLADHVPRQSVARLLREVPWTILSRPWDARLNDVARADEADGPAPWAARLVYLAVAAALLLCGIRTFRRLLRGPAPAA